METLIELLTVTSLIKDSSTLKPSTWLFSFSGFSDSLLLSWTLSTVDSGFRITLDICPMSPMSEKKTVKCKSVQAH
jgi:hypothetical protein